MSKSTAVVPWQEELDAHINEGRAMVAQSAGGGKYVSLADQEFSYNGEAIGDSIEIIVLDSVRENAYYEKDWSADERASPVCWAVSRTPRTMGPTDAVEGKQNETCEGCGMNEFGSARRGKGKACNNKARIAFVAWNGEDEEAITESEILLMRTPVTSTGKWLSYYDSNLLGGTKSLLKVVTKVVILPHKKNRMELNFSSPSGISIAHTEALVPKMKQARELIMHGFATNAELQEEKPKRDESKRAYAGKGAQTNNKAGRARK